MSKPHPGSPYFAAVGDALRENYLRYSFTKGTAQEIEFLLGLLDLPSGARVLDVGCGAGRHSVELARAGLAVTAVDISAGLLEVARASAEQAGVKVAFFQIDARELPFADEFDAVISICQGAFGLMGDDDSVILRRMAEATRTKGLVVLSAFSAAFEAGHRRPEATFDLDAGVVHDRTQIKARDGSEQEVDLWTGVYTPRELRLLSIGVGLVPEEVWGVEPGDFGRRPPDLELPELMLVARKPRWK